MNTDDFIKSINEQGWFVNNLFQLKDGKWRANLRDFKDATHFGDGDTPLDALKNTSTKSKVPLLTDDTFEDYLKLCEMEGELHFLKQANNEVTVCSYAPNTPQYLRFQAGAERAEREFKDTFTFDTTDLTTR